MKAFYLFCMAVLSLLTVTIPLNATVWTKWSDQTTQQTMDGPIYVDGLYSTDFGEYAEFEVYQIGADIYNPQYLPTDDSSDYHNVAVPNSLLIEGGRTDPGDIWFDSDANYPVYVRILLKVRNSGTTNWTDFHLRTTENSTVYKIYGTLTGWDTVQDENGWDSIYNPDPNAWNDPPVQPGEFFYNETWIVVNPNANHWTVEIWPTPVPEPLSIFLLGMGLAFIRRIRGG